MPDYPIAQHHAPVPNDVSWYVIAAALTVGAALVAFGVAKATKRWQHETGAPIAAAIAGEVFGITLAAVGAMFAGWLVWNWGLGLCCGMIGGWASPIVLRLAWKFSNR